MKNDRQVLEELIASADSVEDLAAEVGVSRATIYNWLAGGITAKGRFQIAQKFPHTASRLIPKFE